MDAYRRAGVDLAAAARSVDLIREVARGSSRPEVVEAVGGFAGLFRISKGRLLAAATDGVGTKVELARLRGRLGGLGIDLVAMCADDVVCTGAEPLFFLDYLAVGRLDPDEVALVVGGVAEGCRHAGCALLGGETAEHPGVWEPGRLDLAGFCVGVVDEDRLLGPHRVVPGDVVIGLASSGPHANGFSLVRRILDDTGVSLDHIPPGMSGSVADTLLEPTRIYAPAVIAVARDSEVHAPAHVTGGGIPGNLERVLPRGLGAELDRNTWDVPPVFGFLAERGGVPEKDMFATFNMGLGMLVVMPAGAASDAVAILAEAGIEGRQVGTVVEGEGVHIR